MKLAFITLSLFFFLSTCAEKCNRDKTSTDEVEEVIEVEEVADIDSEQSDSITPGYTYLLNFLQNEGYKYEIVENNDILFKVEGHKFVAGMQDTPYLQIISAWNIDNVPVSKLLKTCNTMNLTKYVIKFQIKDSESLWCTYELEPNNSTNFDYIFHALIYSAQEFFEQLGK